MATREGARYEVGGNGELLARRAEIRIVDECEAETMHHALVRRAVLRDEDKGRDDMLEELQGMGEIQSRREQETRV